MFASHGGVTLSRGWLCQRWNWKPLDIHLHSVMQLLTEGFFVLPVWGAYTWRGLFSELYGNLNNNEKHAKAMGTLETSSNFFSNFAITSPDS